MREGFQEVNRVIRWQSQLFRGPFRVINRFVVKDNTFDLNLDLVCDIHQGVHYIIIIVQVLRVGKSFANTSEHVLEFAMGSLPKFQSRMTLICLVNCLVVIITIP